MGETTLVYRSDVAAPVETVLAWHRQPGAFARLTPPWLAVRVLDAKGTIAPGDWKRLRIKAGLIPLTWTLVHRAGLGDIAFVDEQERGPFRFWRHEHIFHANGSGCTVEDRLTYQLPFGSLGQAVAGQRVQRRLDDLFRFRHRQTQIDIPRHVRAGFERPQRIAITGASGMIGSQLVPFLQAGGHEIVRLVRHQPQTPSEIRWDPATQEIDTGALEGLDAVIHLAGVSIAGGRWTSARKDAILDSRVQGTTLLARTLARLHQPPRVFVSTSAIGYYGDTGTAVVTERFPAGSDFLANVCRAWEEAAAPAADAGIRVVHPRFAIVLSGYGGLLPLIARAFRFGLGGPLGSGHQFMSWIALDDLLGILLEALANERLSGPINATALYPVTNREFTKTLARVLHRPAFLPAPAPALRLVAGELADDLILASQRAQPVRLVESGFCFALPVLEGALRHALGRYQ